MEQKHHLLPQFLLKRFAENGQLGLTDRELRWRRITSVERAGREGGFYTLGQEIALPPKTRHSVSAYPPLANILERRRDGGYAIGPDSIEKTLSMVEGVAGPAMERLIDGPWPPAVDDRLYLALFIAFQFTRGLVFREDIDAMIRATRRLEIERNPDYFRDRWREFNGADDDPDPLPNLIRSLDGLYLSQDNKLALMMRGAIELAPVIAARRWRLLCLNKPDFVLSDEPVALWTRRDQPQEQGVATADLVYVPVDAWHCLQLARPDRRLMTEARIDGATKLRQANNAVAANAHRWIWFHPGCGVVDNLVVRATRGPFRVDPVLRTQRGDVTTEIVRMYRERL